MPATKVTKSESEIENDDGSTRKVVQFRATVPKGVAEALDMDGDEWEWQVESADRVSIQRVTE